MYKVPRLSPKLQRLVRAIVSAPKGLFWVWSRVLGPLQSPSVGDAYSRKGGSQPWFVGVGGSRSRGRLSDSEARSMA